MIAERQIITHVLHHLITVAEIQSLQYQINEAISAKDYDGASQINKIISEKKDGLLPLDTMKEYHQILSQNANVPAS